MKKNKFEHYKNLFDGYTNKFIANNNSNNIQLKLTHSYKVCENMEKLAKALNLSQESLRIAKIIGLLHDIARFPQYGKYGTFRDDLSFDHAAKAVEIIEAEKFFKNEEKEVARAIKNSIENHNKEKIFPASMDNLSWFFARLIRDADKLDIYETLVNYHLDDKLNGKINTAIELNLPNSEGINPAAIQDIIDCRIISSDHIKNINDLILLQMGWVFDINFKETMRIIATKKYIPQLAQALPEQKDIKLAVSALERKIEAGVSK